MKKEKKKERRQSGSINQNGTVDASSLFISKHNNIYKREKKKIQTED